MKKILFATDFSEDSQKAFAYTQQLAKKLDAELLVIHTYLPPYVDPSTPVELIGSLHDELVYSLTGQLNALVSDATMPVATKLVYSDIRSGVLDTATEEGCDMIVIGKTGQTGFLKKLIGSNAAALVNSSKLPILMVPADVATTLPTHLVYGTQLEFNENSLIQKAVDLADKLDAQLTLANVSAPFEPNIRPDEPFKAQIKDKFDLDVTMIDASRISDGLLEFVDSVDAGLLIVTSHHRNFLTQLINPSKSQKVINKAQVPVLVYHFSQPL